MTTLMNFDKQKVKFARHLVESINIKCHTMPIEDDSVKEIAIILLHNIKLKWTKALKIKSANFTLNLVKSLFVAAKLSYHANKIQSTDSQKKIKVVETVNVCDEKLQPANSPCLLCR
jgi:hypothetical protein